MGTIKKVGGSILDYYDNKVENALAQNKFVNDNSVKQGAVASGIRGINNAFNVAVSLTPLPISYRGVLNKIPVGQAKYSSEELKKLNKSNYENGVNVSEDERLAALGQSKKGRETVDNTIMKLDQIYGKAAEEGEESKSVETTERGSEFDTSDSHTEETSVSDDTLDM